MLYHLYEMNHIALTPLRKLAKCQKELLETSYNPLLNTFLHKTYIAAYELFENSTRRYDKPDWNLNFTRINGLNIPVQDRVVWSKPFCNLVHFQRAEGNLDLIRKENHVDPRVLVIAPMSGHYATLLRNTVEAFLPDHDVYISDWVDCRNVPVSEGRFDLNDYIDYVIEMIEFLGPDVHILAVCQPGPAVLAAISVMSEDNNPNLPASFTVMGSPIDPRKSPTVPNELAAKRPISWFRRNVVHRVPYPNKGFMRQVYPGFMQLTGFISMNRSRHLSAAKEYFANLVKGDMENAEKHREFYDEYLAVMDMPAEFYLQTIDEVFQRFLLPKGEFMHRGRLVKPEAITKVALMTVEGENDDISGIGQTQAAHDLCVNIPEEKQVDYIQPGVGHYGVFSGRRFREEIMPRVREFIRANTDWDRERQVQRDLTRRIWSESKGAGKKK
jgi:poly(3-hydroxybutyrate) depolymerase